MLYTIPDYYHEFSCIAGECEDTCCAGWQIVADEAALKKYKKVTGSFKKRLRKSINWKEGTFKQDKNKRKLKKRECEKTRLSFFTSSSIFLCFMCINLQYKI